MIWNCDWEKSLGSNGFNFGFYRVYWSFLKEDILKFVNEFHSFALLPKAVTASFIALISKVDSSIFLDEVRPICLIESMYRIITKLLASKLKVVVGKLISNCQSAFIPTRNMLAGVLIVNELLDLTNRKKKSCMLVKLDFETAYDCVSWDFLRYMLRRMGFGDKWMGWMEALVFNNSISILVNINGSPTKDFEVSGGLRQGDALSPFLFLLVAENLSEMMSKASILGEFHGFRVDYTL